MKLSYQLLFILVFLCFKQELSAQNELFHEIVAMDSIYFKAYNECDIPTQDRIYAADIEFYHDMGGLQTSKKALLEAIEKNICGKVTRELIPGSIEVSPIPGFGAVELGQHQFHNKQEPGQIPHASRFVIIWQKDGADWKITRVISLH